MQPNKALLSKVRDYVALHGERCNMDDWIIAVEDDEDDYLSRDMEYVEGSCGTTLCIGGITAVLDTGGLTYIARVNKFFDGNKNEIRSISNYASEALGIDQNWFYKDQWPHEFLEIAQDEGDAKAMLAVLNYLLDEEEED